MPSKLFASPEERQKIKEQELKNKTSYITEAKYNKLKNSVKSAGEWTFAIGGIAQLLVLVLYLFLGISPLGAVIVVVIVLIFSFLGWKIKQLKAKNIDGLMYLATLVSVCVIFMNTAFSNKGGSGVGFLVWIMLIKQIIGCVAVTKLVKIQEFKDSLI